MINTFCQGVCSLLVHVHSSKVEGIEESYERNNNHQGKKDKQKSAGGCKRNEERQAAAKGCWMCVSADGSLCPQKEGFTLRQSDSGFTLCL